MQPNAVGQGSPLPPAGFVNPMPAAPAAQPAAVPAEAPQVNPMPAQPPLVMPPPGLPAQAVAGEGSPRTPRNQGIPRGTVPGAPRAVRPLQAAARPQLTRRGQLAPRELFPPNPPGPPGPQA